MCGPTRQEFTPCVVQMPRSTLLCNSVSPSGCGRGLGLRLCSNVFLPDKDLCGRSVVKLQSAVLSEMLNIITAISLLV